MKCKADKKDICHNPKYCEFFVGDECPYFVKNKDMNKSTFTLMLEQMQAIHDKKSADYSQPTNKYSNFERASLIADWFEDATDRVFVTMIGIKLARIAELSQPGRVPNNESLEDSFLDLCTYCVLWASYAKTKIDMPEQIPVPQYNQVSVIGINKSLFNEDEFANSFKLAANGNFAKRLSEVINANGIDALMGMSDASLANLIINHLKMIRLEQTHNNLDKLAE